MPDYLTPGVYVEEVELGPPPITGVSTSIPGFVGATQMGPTSGGAQLVTSYSDFERMFGGFLPASSDPTDTTNFLAYAANGFFQNGGQIAYVQRVIGAGATASDLTLEDAITDGGAVYFLTQPAQQMPPTMDRISLVAARFISAGTEIRLIQQTPTGEVSDIATVQQVDGDAVTFTAPTSHRYSAAAVVEVPAPAGYTPAPTLTLQASSEGTWGQNLLVTVTPSSRTSARVLQTTIQTTLEPMAVPLTLMNMADAEHATLDDVSLLRDGDQLHFSEGAAADLGTIAAIDTGSKTVTFANPLSQVYTGGATVALQDPPALRVAADDTTVAVAVASATGLAAGQNVQIEDAGGPITGSIDTVAGTTVNLTLTTAFPAARSLAVGALLTVANPTTASQLNLGGASNLSPGDIVEFTDAAFARSYGTVQSITGNAVTFAAPVPAGIATNSTVRTVEFDLAVQLTSTDPVTGLVSVLQQENYRFLNVAPSSPNNAVTRINPVSALVTAGRPAAANGAPQGYPTTISRGTFTAAMNLTGGDSGAALTADDYIQDPGAGPGQRKGIQSLQDIDEIAIIAAPGMADPDVHAALIDQCELLKYRFAVLEAPRGSTIPQVEAYRNQFDTRYAAIYYPWITLHDPLTGSDGLIAPPSGHVIGVYANVDNTRGVHKAPANEVLAGITGLELTLTGGEQGVLNEPRNIDVIRDFRSSQRGIRIWGARCITSQTDWKYVNVRRLFIYLEHSLDQGTQWVVFEPNAEPLWARARQSVTAFLTTVWRNGALMGTTAEEAFFVTCDRTTMTQDDIDNGRLIMLIGVAPVFPAEFVIIRIGQQAAGASVSD
jgi:phage tail sheath protein FI